MPQVQFKDEENPAVVTRRTNLEEEVTREELCRIIQSKSIPRTLKEFFALQRLGRNYSLSTK